MSLSAKERILKLRETEFKLQKLQNDIFNGSDNSSIMSEFLSHHKELMTLPGSNRDSLPFRFSFEAPQRYVQMKQTQKLTLPPKIPEASVGRLKPFKDVMDESEIQSVSYKTGLAGHRSLALQSLLGELDKHASRVDTSKLSKYTLNKTPFLRKLQSQTSKRYTDYNGNTKTNSIHSSSRGGNPRDPSINDPTKLSIDPARAKKLKVMWNHELSETASTATASELILDSDNFKVENKRSADHNIEQEIEDLRESVAYALGSSNLMGVILPSNSTHSKRGPNAWGDKRTLKSTSTVDNEEIDGSSSISAKEAVTVLRRRKFPERKSPLLKALPPHERGLIGVEISNFEPQCAFFYRDRNGNYNPHLHHSKNVTESMKNWNKGRTFSKSLL